ncbi:MAG TPA: DUF4412 domain-containing protein [Candidatus Sulfotelmatobacter sp.]|nr:DUF4412 domain-containing protein [Candidatus Sulfotelmatobacter sp.]
MKTRIAIVLTGVLCLSLASAYAQFAPQSGGGMMRDAPHGPRLNASTAKLFGDNTAFSANLEMQTKGAGAEETMTMPGKLAFDQGKSRFEMDMSQMKGAKMPPEAANQMKSMGMDKMIIISLPAKQVSYLIYPGLQAYVENPLQAKDAAEPAAEFKVEASELGKETIDGHPCIKNKSVVTDKEGNKHEALVWNATDLKQFPIKIEQNEQGTAVTMLFKDIDLSKPEASLFEPPTGFTKYDNMQAMMQQVMMKRMGGGMGGALPLPRPPRTQQ